MEAADGWNLVSGPMLRRQYRGLVEWSLLGRPWCVEGSAFGFSQNDERVDIVEAGICEAGLERQDLEEAGIWVEAGVEVGNTQSQKAGEAKIPRRGQRVI